MNTPDARNPSDAPIITNPVEPVARVKKTRRSRYDPEPDWSAMVRDKVKNSKTRVGQACDRCKFKRMKCSPDPKGCVACISLNIPCKVTDLVTGETMVRGEVSRMRERIESLKGLIVQLEQKNAELQERLDGLYRAGLMDSFEPLDPRHHHHSLL